MRRLTLAWWLPLCVPGAVVAVFYAALAAGGLVRVEWLWPSPNVNLAEAATLGDVGEVLRHLSAGADPNARMLVSRGFANRDPVFLTPLEAAVERQRPDMVRVLILNGARADHDTIAPLRCVARRLRDPKTEAELTRYDSAPVDCQAVTLPPL